MKKSKRNLTPKFKIGDKVVIEKDGNFKNKSFIVTFIEPALDYDQCKGAFWYHYDIDAKFAGGRWSEDYLRLATKLEQALS